MTTIPTSALSSALAAHTLGAITLVFVPPQARSTRIASTVAITALCLEALRRTNRFTDEGQSYAEYMVGFALYANCFLQLLRLEPPVDRRESIWWRLSWAVETLFTPRRLLSQKQDTRESRGTFLLSRAALAVWTGAAYYLLRRHVLLPFTPVLEDYSRSRDSMLLQLLVGTLTTRSLFIRAETTLKALTLPALSLTVLHSLFSLLAVGAFNSAPSDWPPLFGSLREAYTLRRWYSHFWHKLMRKAFTMNAAALTNSVFGLETWTVSGRASVVLLSFLISGLMHTATGWPCARWKPLWGCLATSVAILVEQAAVAGYEWLHRVLGWRWSWSEVVMWRLVGYWWVITWWLEVVPATVFPATRCYVRQKAVEMGLLVT